MRGLPRAICRAALIASGVACELAAGGALHLEGQQPASAPIKAQTITDAKQARDSVYTLRNAQQALTVHLFRFREYINNGNKPRTAGFSCERSVWPYCFGPANGKLPFGAPLFAIPVEFQTWEPNVPRVLRKTIDRQVARLINELDAAQRKLPGDRWLVGQRVFNLMQHGEIARANDVARACSSDTWWCSALVGYASYNLGKYDRADSAFNVTLATLPPDDACRWHSVEDLLWEDADREWYEKLDCDSRSETNSALWWLADPLWMTPGNERRTAHYHREVFRILFMESNEELPKVIGTAGSASTGFVRRPRSVLGAGSSNGLVTTVAGDVYERHLWEHGPLASLVRALGAPVFAMVEDDATDGFPQILLQYLQPTYHFIPALAAVRSPFSASGESWKPDDVAALERYHPRFGLFRTIQYQVAWFRRGDSAQLVAAADIEGDTILTKRAPTLLAAALAVSTGPDDIRLYHDSISGTRRTFSARIPAESALVSLEAMVSGIGAGRARFASGPPPMPAQRVMLSDILLMRGAADASMTLDAAARQARPNSMITVDSATTLFWEVYGLAAGDTVSYTLTAQAAGESLLRGAARLIGVVGQQRQSTVAWTEAVNADLDITPKSVSLDLGALGRGDHVLHLEVRIAGQEAVRVSRPIVVK